MEEEVGVIFHYTTGGTMLIDMGGVPGYSFNSGKGPSYQSPSEGFDDGW